GWTSSSASERGCRRRSAASARPSPPISTRTGSWRWSSAPPSTRSKPTAAAPARATTSSPLTTKRSTTTPPSSPARSTPPSAPRSPAGRSDEVGGDFYDVISVGDAWMVVIGDVIGKGPAAAALTGLARYSIRTGATLTASPAGALEHLNDDLHREEQSGIISAACVLLRDVDGRAEATIACAGHPPPVRVHAGEPRAVGTASLLLGVAPDARFAEQTVILDDDDTLVLYTDGVLDAQGREERFGERRLFDALRGKTRSAEETLERVVAPLERFQEGAQRDDMAMVVVRRVRQGMSALSRSACEFSPTGG